jgi:hypothetical protein
MLLPIWYSVSPLVTFHSVPLRSPAFAKDKPMQQARKKVSLNAGNCDDWHLAMLFCPLFCVP